MNKKIIKACIIIPTYNEAKNIKKLLDLIFKQENENKKTAPELSILVLVVDDNSPDGTAGIVQKYMEKNEKVNLLLRYKKEGRGPAYSAGMQ